MIAFDLACECGYAFEGWFRDYNDFIKQRDSGLISCPGCNRKNTVRKVLSPVAVHTRDNARMSTIQKSHKEMELTENVEAAVNILRQLQEFVEKNFVDVGAEFAEKTLKIHYGVEEPQNIRGVVSEEEQKILNREGIPLLKIPMMKKNEINED